MTRFIHNYLSPRTTRSNRQMNTSLYEEIKPAYINLEQNYLSFGKIGCYHISLYRLSSRVGDKRTRTADIRHRENQERRAFPLFSARLFVLRMSDCPSPTLTAQTYHFF
uniref:Uncharacterized protein n=1 Tax=Kalanchoe fedtschenkoi TaxID=63787 RepID=A0A7N0V0Z9_KALFE